MDSTLGKHLLIDCYGCKPYRINNFSSLNEAVEQAIEYTGMDIFDTQIFQNENTLVLNAVGLDDHICIHSYPEYQYLAIDVFTFDTDIDPTSVMKILRLAFRPDKMRATSIKRGKLNSRDMKPKVKSKTTTMHRVKSTGQQIKRTSGKVFRVLRKKN